MTKFRTDDIVKTLQVSVCTLLIVGWWAQLGEPTRKGSFRFPSDSGVQLDTLFWRPAFYLRVSKDTRDLLHQREAQLAD